MKKICCKNCENEYEVELCANFMTFCPKCNSYNFMECEYGYGPVVPCRIYHGDKVIGMVNNDSKDRMKYRVDLDGFNVHKILNKRYLEALQEARDMVTDFLNSKLKLTKKVL